MPARFPSTSKLVVASVAICCYLLLLSYHGLLAYFTPDDVMNIQFLHGFGRIPFWLLVTEAIATFTPAYRPVGGVYYRACYALFGFHPLPFRILFFALILLNLFLVARCVRTLTHSYAVTLFATLIYSFHPVLYELYFNGGTIYDLLCAFFFVLALTLYLRVRQAGAFLNTRHLLQIAALFAGALGSKEMAIALPAVFLLYEALFWPNRNQLGIRLRPILLTAAMALACMVIKLFTPNPMSANELYSPWHSFAHIARAYVYYHRLLLFRPELSGHAILLILAAAIATALLLRSKAMLFGIGFTWLVLFPVSTIAPRSGFVWYLPAAGYALYLGALLSRMAAVRPKVVQPALFCVVLAVLLVLYLPRARKMRQTAEQDNLKILVQATQSAAPSLPHGSRLLLLRDPFPPTYQWSPLFAIRLAYHDASLWVDRLSHLGNDYHPADISLYAMTLDWDGATYITHVKPQSSGPKMGIQFAPDVIHRGHESRIAVLGPTAACQVDAAYRLPEDELMRAGIWDDWTNIDQTGGGTIYVDQNAERGLVVIDWIRLCGGPWLLSRGSFSIIP